MANPHGTPIWYELLADDLDKVRPFYQAVTGWTISAAADPGATGMAYHMIERPGGGNAGGAMALTPQMLAGGARPCWMIYFGVDDVDAVVEQARVAGGQVHMGPVTMEGVGRMAMLADPQGAMFYVMRGQSDQDSDVYSGMQPGGGRWNELSSSDAPAAVKFYGELLRFGTDNFMPMNGDDKYVFIEVGGQPIGAIGPQMQPGAPSMWLPYFGVADIEAARAAVEGAGGTVAMGPMEVPGGDWIIIASDPAGATVGFVGAKGA